MGKVAFVFPGQGSQQVGMGRAAFEQAPAARAVFETADRVLGTDLSTLCFEGPEEALKLTENTQPAVLTTSIALWRLLDRAPDVCAGHSLGEYSAHVVAGTLAFEEAVQLVRSRARYMQEAVPAGQGAMAAVMGLDRARVEAICKETPGIVEPANYNSGQQIVVAGESSAVERAAVALKEAGGKVIPLAVSAPFHTSMMVPAGERLLPHLEKAEFREPQVPVYANVDGRSVSSAQQARQTLIRQVSAPVRWQDSVDRMIRDGVTLFVEIGPGRVLSGLIGRIDRKALRVNVQGPADIEPAHDAIRKARG